MRAPQCVHPSTGPSRPQSPQNFDVGDMRAPQCVHSRFWCPLALLTGSPEETVDTACSTLPIVSLRLRAVCN
jgi:hypothetical protein